MLRPLVQGRAIPQHQPIVFFDGVCVLCNAGVKFVIKRDNPGTSNNKIAFFQSRIGQELLQAHNITQEQCMERFCVLTPDNKMLNASSAALHLAKYLPFPYPLVGVFWIVPRFLRDFVYDVFAKNRYKWFGIYETCVLYKGKEDVLQRFIDKDEIDMKAKE